MKKYPLFKVHVKTHEALERIKEVLNSGFMNEGVQVSQLTTAFKVRMRTQNLIMTNSCTSALTLALRLAGLKSLDDVISTPMTCVATNTPIVTQNADIIWADIDPNTGCISTQDVARLLEENPDTKIVMAVAWAGIPPDLEPLVDVCHKHGAKLILDAAHAMGAMYKDKAIHEWADFTCYSLQAIKHITTGDGGILVSKDKDDHERAKRLKWFGIDRDKAKDSDGNWKGQHWDFDIAEAGHKFNMNNLTAALGLAQMPYVDGIIENHRYNSDTYDYRFKKSKYITPMNPDYDCNPSNWVYTVRLDVSKVDKMWLLEQLNKEGIAAGIVHVPNHGYTCFKKYERAFDGVTEFSKEQFSLPVGWWLDDDDVKHIAARVEALCENYDKQLNQG